MLNDDRLLISLRELARTNQRGPVLLLLSQIAQPAQTRQIKQKGASIGFRVIEKWNVTDILKKAAAERHVAQRDDGWRLLDPGYKSIEAHFLREGAIVQEARHSLRSHLGKITDAQRRSFLDEAILSFDVKAYRAAIVLSWVGAAHLLQESVILHHRAAFNVAGNARALKAAASGSRYQFYPVRTLRDFGAIGEADFLQLCQDAGILHKAEKQLLGDRLDLRNQCGHPNPITVAEHVVASHIEILMLNVYSKY